MAAIKDAEKYKQFYTISLLTRPFSMMIGNCSDIDDIDVRTPDEIVVATVVGGHIVMGGKLLGFVGRACCDCGDLCCDERGCGRRRKRK